MPEKWLIVDLAGHIVGSTKSQTSDGLFRATHPTTGENYGLVELKPFDWPRERVRKRDLQDFEITPA